MKMFKKRFLALFLAFTFFLSGVPLSLNVYADEIESSESEVLESFEEDTKHLLSVSVEGGGSIDIEGAFETVSDSTFSIISNEEIQISFKEDENYRLANVMLNDDLLKSENGIVKFNMPEEDSTLKVVFEEVKSEDTILVLNKFGEGTLDVVGDYETVSSSSIYSVISVKPGSELSVVATPEEGYLLGSIVLNEDILTPDENSVTFKVPNSDYNVLEVRFPDEEVLIPQISKYAIMPMALGDVGETWGMYWLYLNDGTHVIDGLAPNGSKPASHVIQLDDDGDGLYNETTYTVYCTQYGVYYKPGMHLTNVGSLSESQRDYIGYALAYGWRQSGTRYDAPQYEDLTARVEYLMTQGIIWCCGRGIFNTAKSEHIMDQLINYSWNPSHARQYYEALKTKILNAKVIPSFASSSANSGTLHKLTWNSSKQRYEKTLTDSNGVISEFNNYQYSGLGMERNGNSITLYTTQSFPTAVTAGNWKELDGGSGAVVSWDAQYDWQNMATYQRNIHNVYSYIRFYTEDTTGTITLNKKSAYSSLTSRNSNYSLEGAVYTVYSDSACTKAVGTITTNASGNGSLSNVTVGTYYVKETKASKGYRLDTNIYTVNVTSGGSASVSSKETPDYGYIAIQKASSKSDLTNGNSNYSLQGAVYTVYNSSGSAVTTITTDANGYGKSSVKLALGTYTVKETSPSKGYNLDTNTYTTNVVSNATSNGVTYTHKSYEPPILGKISIQKKSARPDVTDGNNCYSLKGAKFTVKDWNGNLVTTLVTDAEGKASVANLPMGTYKVQEIEAPKGYVKDGNPPVYTVKVDSGSIKVLEVENEPDLDPITVVLRKKDAVTGEYVSTTETSSLAGAQFTMKFYGGEYADGVDPATLGKKPTRVWVFETKALGNIAGAILFNNNYKVAGDYYYLEDGTPISTDFYYDDNGVPQIPSGVVTIQETKAPVGYHVNEEIFIRKIDPASGSSSVSTWNEIIIPEKDSSVTLTKKQIGTDVVIPGTKYVLTKPDGSTETFTTDNKGEIYLPGLVAGSYKLQEVSAVNGYVVDDRVMEFKVSGSNNEVSFISQAQSGDNVSYRVDDGDNVSYRVDDGDGFITMYNDVVDYSIEINKYNNEDAKLDGAEFTVYSDSALTQVVGKSETVNGKLVISGLEVEKTYYFTETKAPKGYKIPVDANGKPIVHTLYAEAIPVENKFTFKVDDVEYNTSNTNGAVCLKGNVVDRIVSVSVTNEIMGKLPETGSSLTFMMTLTGIGLMVVSVWYYKKKNYLR